MQGIPPFPTALRCRRSPRYNRVIHEPRRQAMSSVTLQEAQARLPQLLEQLQPGEEITITEHGQPLAQVKKAERSSWPCKAGSARGRIHMAPDLDAPLDDFKESME